MVGELVPVAVDPERADRDFWSRFHVLRRMRHAELHPDDPVEPDDVAEARMKRPNPFDNHYYSEVVREGVMLGWFSGENASPANPEYETNKHLLWGDIYVRPENRRRGLATRLLPVIAQLMDRPDLRKRMGEFGRQRVENELQWLKVSRNLLKAYEHLFARG